MARPAISLKGRALRYLSAREHSRIELARKLARYAVETDDIDALLDTLEAANLLSQARFCDSLINRRAQRYGNSRIVAELQSHGVGSEALTGVKATLAEGEVGRAKVVWQRRFGSVAIDAAGRAKQQRFLQQRGFSQSAIRAAMTVIGDDVLTSQADDSA
jgi:regulatory protein